MRRIRKLGFALLAICALSAIAVASASATEAGFLPLKEVKGGIKYTGSGAVGKFVVGAGTIE